MHGLRRHLGASGRGNHFRGRVAQPLRQAGHQLRLEHYGMRIREPLPIARAGVVPRRRGVDQLCLEGGVVLPLHAARDGRQRGRRPLHVGARSGVGREGVRAALAVPRASCQLVIESGLWRLGLVTSGWLARRLSARNHMWVALSSMHGERRIGGG